MALDFQLVRQRVIELGQKAPERAKERALLRERAWELLETYASQYGLLDQRVEQVVRSHDPNLRCALPVHQPTRAPEPLDGRFPQPSLPVRATILAADGSQIAPDRHAEVNYCLINVGAIQMERSSPEPPATLVSTKLFYGDDLYTDGGIMTDGRLALQRDFSERQILVELSKNLPGPVISFTDGPMELWGSREGGDALLYGRILEKYLAVLADLRDMGVATAGYVDKPAANLVLRLLEVMLLEENELPQVKGSFPLRGVTDFWLFRKLLQPGERSAVFAIQSKSAKSYPDDLALFFFYLNVGLPGRPWLARVEVPAWVVKNPQLLDDLHAVLVEQCRIMGRRSYPYLLHRAHETAVVTMQEKEQVTQMILQELRRRGVEIGETSDKQAFKDLQGRTRY